MAFVKPSLQESEESGGEEEAKALMWLGHQLAVSLHVTQLSSLTHLTSSSVKPACWIGAVAFRFRRQRNPFIK